MVVCYILFNSNTILDMGSMEVQVMGTFLIIACTVYVVWCLWPEKK